MAEIESSKEKLKSDKEHGSLEHPALGYEYYFKPGQKPGENIELSQEEETNAFVGLAQQVAQMQMEVAHGGAPGRAFHNKQQGCLAGRLTVYDETAFRDHLNSEFGDRVKNENINVDELHNKVARGLFKEPASYNVFTRFSNASEFKLSDKQTDGRGFAMSLLEKSDGTPLPQSGAGTGTQDFLMFNGEIIPAPDAFRFVDVALLKHNIALNPPDTIMNHSDYLRDHPDVLPGLARIAKNHSNIPSLATERFWGASPYRWGSDEQGSQVVKFQVKAIDNQASESSEIPDGAQKDDANYLRQDLQARINKGPIKYEFYVQLQTDPAKTPLENAAKEWTEKDSMPIPVGEVEFFQGQNMDAPGAQELCEMTSFSPSHYVEGHKAIGNVNRGREVLYNFSGAQRNAQVTSAEQVKKVYGPFPR